MASFIYLRPGTTIRSYSSASKCEKATVRIEIEVADADNLGFLLRDIAEAKKELKAGAAPVKQPSARSVAPRHAPARAIEHRPVLALPFLADDDGEPL